MIPASANTNDHLILEDALDALEERFGAQLPERPMIHADAGFDVRWVMEMLSERGYGYDIVCSFGDISHKRNPGMKLSKRSPGQRAKNRWHVERTNSWFRQFGRIARSPERRIAAAEAWMDLTHAVVVTRCLIRESWYSHRWEGRPERNPFPNGRRSERRSRRSWERLSAGPKHDPAPT